MHGEAEVEAVAEEEEAAAEETTAAGVEEGTGEKEEEHGAAAASERELAEVELTEGRVGVGSPDVLMATLGFGEAALPAPPLMLVRFAKPELPE